MTSKHIKLDVSAPSRGLHEITSDLIGGLKSTGVTNGLMSVFIQHTSASLLVQENADPSVLEDLESWAKILVKEDSYLYQHRSEGKDDMPAHIKSALTATYLNIPIEEGRLMLGTWQGVFLWEHRDTPRVRHLIATILDFDQD